MQKIINDPVYGFITINNPLLLQLINHPWLQRLRRIKQMGIAHFVYPGAVHTRFHHSLGAMSLMSKALHHLKEKGIAISDEECEAAQIAILLHDIGHGPFSHALEYAIVKNVSHEHISALIMEDLNVQFNGALSLAIAIFKNEYAKTFLHQLVSSQLDMDRMDYLNRDSFYSGVSEGIIGYDRILQMINVVDNNIVVEEKGIHSVEKFIIARRMMYWQVYLHKTVLGVEKLIIKILQRAKELANNNVELFGVPNLSYFLYHQIGLNDFITNKQNLEKFCSLDDADISSAIKVWCNHDDKILSTLCKMLVDRKLYKVKLSTERLNEEYSTLYQKLKSDFSEEELSYYLLEGKTTNKTYNQYDELITVQKKDGTLINISQVENALINPFVTLPITKHYICIAPILAGKLK